MLKIWLVRLENVDVEAYAVYNSEAVPVVVSLRFGVSCGLWQRHGHPLRNQGLQDFYTKQTALAT